MRRRAPAGGRCAGWRPPRAIAPRAPLPAQWLAPPTAGERAGPHAPLARAAAARRMSTTHTPPPSPLPSWPHPGARPRRARGGCRARARARARRPRLGFFPQCPHQGPQNTTNRIGHAASPDGAPRRRASGVVRVGWRPWRAPGQPAPPLCTSSASCMLRAAGHLFPPVFDPRRFTRRVVVKFFAWLVGDSSSGSHSGTFGTPFWDFGAKGH